MALDPITEAINHLDNLLRKEFMLDVRFKISEIKKRIREPFPTSITFSIENYGASSAGKVFVVNVILWNGNRMIDASSPSNSDDSHYYLIRTMLENFVEETIKEFQKKWKLFDGHMHKVIKNIDSIQF